MTLHSNRMFPDSAEQSLEHSYNFKLISATFPHLGKKLALFWGEPEFHALMEELLQNNRENARAGLPVNVLQALHHLVLMHDKEHPELVHKEPDLWNLSQAR